MIIATVKLYRYLLPLKRPLILRTRRLEQRTGYLVRFIDENGREGVGEAAPLPGFSREWVYETKLQLQRCAGLLAGQEISNVEEALNGLTPVVGTLFPSVRFGLHTALSMTSAAGLPASPCRDFVSLNALITMDMRDCVEELSRIRESGYRTVKIKVGSDYPELDAEAVRKIAHALGDSVRLRLDANRRWSIQKALHFAERVAGCNIEYVEEPVRSLAELRLFAKHATLPYALDETLHDEVVEPPLAEGAAAWVIKPTLGGLQALDRAESRAHRPKLVVSSSHESGFGLSVLALMAASLNDSDVPAGLDTYGWLGSDLLAKPLPLPSPILKSADVLESMRSIDFGRCEEIDW
ncbi:MAG: o-succinylbenzoate synthase [Candidatus Hydrogenedentota bacterium]